MFVLVTFLMVIKHHDQGDLQWTEFIWAYDSRALGFMVAERRHGSKTLDHQKPHKSKG